MGRLICWLFGGGWLVVPVYQREVARGVAPRRLSCVWVGCVLLAAALLCGLTLAVAATEGVLSGVVVGALAAILGLPLLVIPSRLQIAASASDVIAREVEAGTWDDLGALPWSAADLIRAKYAAALRRADGLFLTLFLLRCAITGMTFLCFGPSYLSAYLAYNGDARLDYFVVIGLALIAGAYLFIEPAVDFAADTALGVAASAFAQTRSRALGLAVALGVFGMAAQYAIGELVARTAAALAPGPGFPGYIWNDLGMMGWRVLAWGVAGNLVVAATPAAGIVALAAVLAARYASIRGMLALAAWRMERR